MTQKYQQARLYEYRIKYNVGLERSAFDNYHYYMAESAEQAFEYHLKAMRRHHAAGQNLCVEQKNPWVENTWEDVSEVLKSETEDILTDKHNNE